MRSSHTQTVPDLDVCCARKRLLHLNQVGGTILMEPLLKVENTSRGTESVLKSKDDSWQGGLIAVQSSINNSALPGNVSSVALTGRKLQRRKQRERQRQEKRERKEQQKEENWTKNEVGLENNGVVFQLDEEEYCIECNANVQFVDDCDGDSDDNLSIPDEIGYCSEHENYVPTSAVPNKYTRRHSRQRVQRQHGQNIIQNSSSSRFKNSCLVHVLKKRDMDDLKSRGMVFINVSCPVRVKVNKINIIKWSLSSSSSNVISSLNLESTNISIVTTYDQVKNDEMLAYIGSLNTKKPHDDDCILLAMIIQQDKQGTTNHMNVQDVYKMCKLTKPNMNKAKSSNHHKGEGGVFGFGYRKDFRIDSRTGSSVKEFVWNDGKDEENSLLDKMVSESMDKAVEEMKMFVKYDLHKLNGSQLKATVAKAELTPFASDLRMKGKSQYSSFFMNFDASTLEPHREFDMNMTTIYVPEQNWIDKSPDHLQFRFHLTGDDDGIISIPMKPGTIIFFHAYLVTHHQLHANGTCTLKGCCLNYSAYANRKLLSYFIKSYHRAKAYSAYANRQLLCYLIKSYHREKAMKSNKK